MTPDAIVALVEKVAIRLRELLRIQRMPVAWDQAQE